MGRKHNKKQRRLSISVSDQIYQLVKDRAEENHRSISEEISYLIDNAISLEAKINIPVFKRLAKMVEYQESSENNPDPVTN